jgi:hypothetical protein
VRALVKIKRRLDGHPAGRPCFAALPDKEVLPPKVGGNIIVTVPRQTQQSRVLIKAVAARCIACQREKIFAAQIINPRAGRIGAGDYKFSARVIKVPVIHGFASSTFLKRFRNFHFTAQFSGFQARFVYSFSFFKNNFAA